jgi:AICAR transformylase/IMP cyclohydrolase PurH
MSVVHTLKYGENPQQQATVTFDEGSNDALALANFKTPAGASIASSLDQMSWVNLKDLSRGLDALTRVAAAYETNTGAVPQIAILIEHTNPCGASAGKSDQVIGLAIESNYRASFGSFLVTNVALTEPVAFKIRQWMAGRPFSGIAAPHADPVAVTYFKRKKGTCHIVTNPALADLGVRSLATAPISHTVRGATLTQTPNLFVPKFPKAWDAGLIADMCLAWGICAASDSICISVVKNQILIANALGQQERAAACELAVLQAKKARRTAWLNGAAVVSDSFFTFADGLDYLARRKVKAIFATSGSIHDKEVAAHAAQFDVIFHKVPDEKARIFSGH